MYIRFCSNMMFAFKELWMHPGLGKTLESQMQNDSMTRDQIVELQQDKLKRLLSHAAQTVPYYREYFSHKKHDLTCLSLGDFPVVGKNDIRGHEKDFVSDVYDMRELVRNRTSGSTGEPFMFFRKKDELVISYADLWRGLARFGIRPGDKRVLVKGVDEGRQVSVPKRMKRFIYGWMNRCLLIDAHFLAASPGHIGEVIRRIVRYRPSYFHGYASSICDIALYAESHGIDMRSLNLKAVVTESEKLYDFQREVLSRVFACPVVENYGSVEFGMIAQPSRDGELCINEDHVFVETDTDGSAIITNLDAYAFPLIRFKNGDALELGGLSKTLPYRTIKKIEGRMAERIKLPNGGYLQGFVVMYPIYTFGKYIQAYQVHQTDLEHVVLRIVERDKMPESILLEITDGMLKLLGDEVDFRVEFVESIPLSKRGKRLFVCSDVQ
ncbi:MAG: phenylacetate--CoA ligase family protein [Kiritimatiellia bacterium]|jgi:phenylacetate-CoA ligase